MSYLHGIEIKDSPRQVILSAGDTAIIGLVGIAPQGLVNTPVLINSIEAGREAFGDDVGGFTIPAALEVIFSRTSAKVVVINVLDNADAEALIDSETNKMTVDASGYWASGIGKAELPETANYAAAVISGIEMLLSVENRLGVKPKIVLAPGYSQLAPVMAKMDAVAVKLNGFAVVDMFAENVQAALAARASGNYAVGSPAVVLCFPRAIRYNSHEGENQPCGLSVFWAAAKAERDAAIGYWFSPSNSENPAILATEGEVLSSLTDAAADTNLLNAQGIVTLFRRAGSGYRIWGNWTAAFPAMKTPDVMIAPRSVRMTIREALIDAAINYLDKTNINRIGVDMILDMVNAFIRNLVGTGVLNPGSECTFETAKNDATQIAQGHLVFTLTEVFAPSLDKLTFEEVIDIESLTF